MNKHFFNRLFRPVNNRPEGLFLHNTVIRNLTSIIMFFRRRVEEENKVNFPKRGEIYYVNFDPTIGVEIKKTRPALIIQNDIGNMYSQATIVAAITSTSRGPHPYEVSVKAGEGGLTKDSLILLNQIRTIDKRRLGKKLGVVSSEKMQEVNEALKISLEITET